MTTRRGVPKVQSTAPKRGKKAAGDAARSADPPWTRGTVLRSAKWKNDREVEEILGKEIHIRTLYTSGSSKSWVSSIPADTEAVTA